MSGPLKVSCALCEWTSPIVSWTLEGAQSALQGHHDRSHHEPVVIVLQDDDMGRIEQHGDPFVPPHMRLDAYPALPDHPEPQPWWHWHRPKTRHQFGRWTAVACRCGALRVTGPTDIVGLGHTPIPVGWPAPNTGWAYEALPAHRPLPNPPSGPGGGSR